MNQTVPTNRVSIPITKYESHLSNERSVLFEILLHKLISSKLNPFILSESEIKKVTGIPLKKIRKELSELTRQGYIKVISTQPLFIANSNRTIIVKVETGYGVLYNAKKLLNGSNLQGLETSLFM